MALSSLTGKKLTTMLNYRETGREVNFFLIRPESKSTTMCAGFGGHLELYGSVHILAEGRVLNKEDSQTPRNCITLDVTRAV
jgi:hypothetical protein